jgi:hypothetical protein
MEDDLSPGIDFNRSYLRMHGHPSATERGAVKALEAIGTNSIPFLLKWLPYESGVEMHLESPDQSELRDRAEGTVDAFKVLGPRASSTVPELERLVLQHPPYPANSYPDVVRRSLAALHWIGPDAIPALTNILAKTDGWAVRDHVVVTLAGAGTNAACAVPMLLKMIEISAANPTKPAGVPEYPNALAPRYAIHAVSTLGRGDPGVFIVLSNLVHHREIEFRYTAIEALTPWGLAAVPTIAPALNDPKMLVRSEAISAMHDIAKSAPTNRQIIVVAAQALQSPHENVRDWAARTLNDMSASTQQFDPRSQRPMEPIYREATNTLRRLAPELLPAHPSG